MSDNMVVYWFSVNWTTTMSNLKKQSMNIRLLALIGFLKCYVKTICLPIRYGAAKER